MMEKYFNSKVKKKDLSQGDLVLRNAQLTTKEQDRGKLLPNWEDPYIIKEVFNKGTYVLASKNGKSLPRT